MMSSWGRYSIRVLMILFAAMCIDLSHLRAVGNDILFLADNATADEFQLELFMPAILPKNRVRSCEGNTGNVIMVDTAQGFVSAIATAESGDTILLAPGSYAVSSFSVNKNITIAGADKYQTTLSVGSYSNINVDDADWIILRFTAFPYFSIDNVRLM